MEEIVELLQQIAGRLASIEASLNQINEDTDFICVNGVGTFDQPKKTDDSR